MTNLDIIFKYYKDIRDARTFHNNQEWFNSKIINSQLESFKKFSKESGIKTFQDSFHFTDSEVSSNKPWVRGIIISMINKIESNPKLEQLKKQKLKEKLQSCLDN